MPQYEIEVPGYGKYRVESPTELTDAQAYAAIQDQIGKEPKPEGGFLPAAKAGLASLKSDIAGVLGRTGWMDVGAAEKYRAEQEDYRQRTFKPTEEGWTEAPVTKIKELLGGSVPYMAAPIVAGGTAALAGAPALVGMGAAGLASAGQLVGSGLSRQVEEGTPLAQTDIQAATLAAIPSAALDMVGFRMVPGIRRLFGAAGAELTPKAAAEIAKQGVKQIAADYTRATGKAMTAEGLTEAGQQVFERLQAGLSITDPAARAEYLDSFLGGAVLGGTLAPAGRYMERGREQAQAQQLQQVEAAKAAAAQQQQEEEQALLQQQQEAAPAFAEQLKQQYVDANTEMQRLNAVVKELSALKDPLSVEDAKEAKDARDAYAKNVMQPLVDQIRRVRPLHPGFDFRPTAPAAPAAAPVGAGLSAQPLEEAKPAAGEVAPEVAAPVDEIEVLQQKAAKTKAAPVVTPTAPAPDDLIASYVEAFMGDPTVAEEIVKNNERIPGLSDEQQAAVMEGLAQRLAQLELEGVEVPAASKAKKPENYWQPNPNAPEDKNSWQDTSGHIHYKMNVALPNGKATITELIDQEQAGNIALKFTDSKGNSDRTLSVSLDGAGRPYWLLGDAPAETIRKNIGDALFSAIGNSPVTNTQEYAALVNRIRAALGTMAAAPAVKKTKGKKASAVAEAPAVEDTTVEPTEPKTLEEAFRPPVEQEPVTGQLLIPGTQPLTRTGAVMTPETLRDIQNELKRLSKELTVARQEGRKKDAMAVIERMRFLQEQTKSTEAGPRITGILETSESRTVETRQLAPTSPAALKTEIARARALPQLTEPQAALLDRIEDNLPSLRNVSGDIAEWLNSMRRGRAAPETEQYISQRLADIERQAQQAVTPRELQGMLVKAAKLPLSNKERGLLRLVGENQATIMADDGARRTVARWLSQDVGQGVGAATQALRQYFGIEEKAPAEQEDMFAAEKAQEVKRAETQKSYEEILNPPKIAERLDERDKAAREQREREERLAALPAQRVSFERRREMIRQIDDAPLKRQAFEDQINDANLSQAERDAAQEQLTTYLAKLKKKAEDKDASYATAYRLRGEESANVQKLKQQLDAEGLTDAQRNKLSARLRAAEAKLVKRDNQLARLRGVEISTVETPEERSKKVEDLFQETYAKALTDEEQELLERQPKGRALGPVTRKAIQPSKVLYTGAEEELGKTETEKRTYTRPDMRLTEARGQKQRDVPINKAEMQAANVAAPGITTEPRVPSSILALRQERQLFDIAQKKVEDLSAKLTNVTERVTAYSKLQNKKADVVDRLAAEQESVQRELAGAKADAARLAPKTAVEKPTADADAVMPGEKGTKKLSKKAKEGIALLREASTDYAFRQSTDLTGTALEAVQDGRILDAIDAIGKGTESEFVRELVKALRPLLLRTKLNVEDNLQHEGKTVAGLYNFQTNTVTLHSGALTEEDFLHELVHAATARSLTLDPKQLTTAQREARAQLEQLFHAIQNDSAFEKEYGKLNIHEFASEVMSNKQLRDKLDARKWKGASLLTKIYRAFMQLIGLNPDSMAGASVDAIYKLFNPSMTAAKAGVVLGSNGVVHPSAIRYAPGLEGAGEITDKVVAKNRNVIDRTRAAAGGWLGMETQFVDRFAPLERVSKTMDSLKGLQMMYYLRMNDQQMNFNAQSVGNGALQRIAKKRADGRTEYLVESVKGANIKKVVDILKKAPAGSPDAANRLFTMYLAGIRAKNKGFHTLHAGNTFTEAELNKVMADIRANKALEDNFKEARDVYNEYNQNLISFLQQAGYVSKDKAARLTAEKDYIPFYREQNGVMTLTIGGEAPIRIGSLKDQPYLHELVGGEQKILDFMTSSVQNTAMINHMALGNLATRNAMNELDAMGLAQVREGKGPDDPKIVRFKVDGEDYHALVKTDSVGVPADLLVKGMAGIPTQLPAAVRMFGLPAKLLRKAVQLNPLYPIRQFMRDSMSATLTSGADFVPVIGSLKELGKSATKDALARRGVTGGEIFTGTSEDMTKILNDMLAGRGNLGTLIAKAEAINMEADAATRRAQYNSYIKQGLSEMEATLMALESMNFSKRGASPSIHMANALIPFFNSQIQGLNVLYKALTGKMPLNDRLKIQEKFITRGLMIAAGSMAYAALMQDDEAYKNANPDEKYGNWFVRIPGVDEPVRIPIPFEVGYIFKALPEAIYNSMANEHGAEEAFKAMKTIVTNTIPGGSSYLIPQALKPAIETGLGKSFYTGRDIVSTREQQLLPEQQFRENTTEIAKSIGSGLGVSPLKIENLVRGYTGTMGIALMQTMSMGIPAGESPEKTAKRLSNLPVVGSVFQPNDAGGVINAVYEQMLEAKKVQTTAERMMQEGRQAEARELVQKHSEEFAQSGVADYFISNIRQLTAIENAVRASGMTGEEKREKLDQIRQVKIRLAETVRKATDEAKKAA